MMVQCRDGILATQSSKALLLFLAVLTLSGVSGGKDLDDHKWTDGADYQLTKRLRHWYHDQIDENSIHAVGNGLIVALSAGPNVDCLFGPPYSSPNVLKLATQCEPGAEATARREIGTAIWHHAITNGGKPLVEFLEYAPVGVAAYVRSFRCEKAGVSWVIQPHAQTHLVPAHGAEGVWYQQLPPGTKIFRDPYITDKWSFHWVITEGCCSATLMEDGSLEIKLSPGMGSVTILGANDYAAGVAQMEAIQAQGSDGRLTATRDWWQQITNRRLASRPELSAIKGDEAEDLDGIAVMIKAQQAVQGPAIIGWHSPMAYIRDLYGASRGMLALGLYDEARQMLDFRYSKFQNFGDLRTAELIGTDAARHTYNDDVEGPAYLLLQIRDYLNATGDQASLRRWWPMMEWCWQVQQKQLAKGLLPFNGDETYVAGGLFPFEGMLQGSADTTLAFLVSGEWLVEWASLSGLWSSDMAEMQRKTLSETRQAWRHWFVADDRIWCNAPERESWIDPPRFRRLGSLWLERDPETGHYVKWDEPRRALPKAVAPPRLTLNSVSLLPDFMGGGPVTMEERRKIVDRIVAHTRPNGSIPTAFPDDCPAYLLDREVVAWDGGKSRIGDRVVGYDPGLLLISQVKLKHPGAKATYTRMMRMLDQAGAWNEYYDGDDKPVRACIRANMWASGINAEAAVNYLLNQ